MFGIEGWSSGGEMVLTGRPRQSSGLMRGKGSASAAGGPRLCAVLVGAINTNYTLRYLPWRRSQTTRILMVTW